MKRALVALGIYVGSVAGMHLYDTMTASNGAASKPITAYLQSFTPPAPNLATKIHLTKLVEHVNYVTYHFNAVDYATGYQVWEADASSYGHKIHPKLVYTAYGSTIDRITTRGLYTTTDFWVRSFYHPFGKGIVYGDWSNMLQVDNYMPWSRVWTIARGSVVKISDLGHLTTTDMGSGWFVPGGYILTCYHVVKTKTLQYFYRISGGSWHLASLVAYDKANDLALLKPTLAAPKSGLIGASDHSPHVGQPAVAIGFPLGQHLVMSQMSKIVRTGVTINVTGYGTLYNMLQARVGTYPGNSGSPIFNHYGEIIGMVEDGPAFESTNAKVALALDGITPLNKIANFLTSAVPKDANNVTSYTAR